MKYLFHCLSNLGLRVLAVLPWLVLHGLADLVFVVLFYVVRYRKEISHKNLTRSFPDKNTAEITRIQKRFYRHLADVMVETAASLYSSERRLDKMFSFSNPEIIHRFYRENQHVVLVLAHYNNWEWASPLSREFDHLLLAVYKPIKNQHYEKTFRKIRGRYGAELVPMRRLGRVLYEMDRNGILTLSGMVADQRPVKQHIRYWTTFLNQDTPVLLGSEKIARKFNAAVVFMKVRKAKRSRYIAEFEVVTENPEATAEYEITERHVRILESLIHEDPACWLWTHDRWKYDRETTG